MTVLEVVLRRMRPAPPRRDALLALPAAAEALEAALGLRFSGEAAVCLTPGSEAASAVVAQSLTAQRPSADGTRIIRREWDSDGHRWLVLTASRLDVLVADVHRADAAVRRAGVGSPLRWSVFYCASPARDCHLVYLHRRGTFYPFAPGSGQRRDAAFELRVRAVVAGALPIEGRRHRRVPLWSLPLA